MIGNAQQDIDKMVLYYHGPFNNKLISQMSLSIKQQLEYDKQLGWRVFSIFVELVQNIYFNAIEHNIYQKNEPIGIVFIEEKEDTFQITAANLASLSSLEKIQDKCDHINQMDTEQLRQYKKELLQLSESNPDYKGGNIGLVQIALLSENKIDFQVTQQEEEVAFFSLTTMIKK